MLAVQPTPAPPAAGVSGALRDVVAADESPPGPSSTSSSTSSTSDDTRPDSGRAFSDDPRPGDKENPFRAPSPNNTSPSAAVRPVKTAVNGAPDSSVAARLSKSQSVIESLQRSLVTKLSPATIESLKSKYASTAAAAPLARPEADLDVDPKLASPLLPVKSVAEATKQSKPLSNGKPAAAVFDVSNAESQSSVKLAFLSGEPAARQQQPARPVTRRAAVERKPLHFPKTVPAAKPPVPAKKDELRAHGKPQVLAVPKKKTPAKPSRASVAQDGLSELLKNLVSDSPTTADKPTERELSFTTASTRPPKPQPAPRTTSLPPHLASPNTPVSPSSTPCPRPPSLSPVQRPSPATSPGRTPPERSRLLEDKLNEIRKDLWEEEAAAAADGRRQRHDSLPGSVSEDAAVPPRSVQEATLEHYARAIQKHLDGRAPAPRLSELRVDTSSSAHSSTSTLVSTPSQSPGWASSTGEPRSLPPTSRSVSSPPPTSPQRRRLRDELLGFYYRSLEREARRPPGRSGRLSAPPLPFTAVIPTDHATYTPDRTLRQEFIVVRDGSPAPEATYQNVHLVRPPPGSPLLASGEDSDSTVQDGRSRPRANMNFFVRGGPQRNTIGAYPTRRTPPRDEVDLRREFGGEVELRHPEKLNAINNKKRHNSESEAADPVVMPVNGRSKNGKPGVFEAWGASNGKDAAKGKKSLFPIFRKGSLHPSAPTTPGTPPPTLPKRVSFSSSTSPISDSVFLPNSPGYACSDTGNGVYGTARSQQGQQNPQAAAGVYGTVQTAPGVFGSSPATPSGLYGTAQKPPSGVYGSTPKSSAGVYGSSSAGVYGTRQQPSPVPYRPPPTGGESPYGTKADHSSPYGTKADHSSPYGTKADHSSPYGTKADHSSPYGTKASPNGVAYSPSQPPAGPAATGSSPGSASVRSAPSPAGTSTSFNASNASFNALNASFNASNASFNASNASSASVSPHGLHLQQQRVYGRAGLPPRAQSATPTMMTMMAPDRPLPPIPIAAARTVNGGLKHSQLTLSESESGSEAGEVQRILQQANDKRKITYCKLEGE
ncbi:hypothetical protein ONE63_001737 [Megalurothrips usitatus]|uniref:Uncharacterized protein n=1 Tax=Megalurothrips usitatus TaxID=439358 RepID=A0AAV7XCD4_9NEOP|nr:hypothetical protein ONE63_001737 [Megalurothrips usitatus]